MRNLLFVSLLISSPILASQNTLTIYNIPAPEKYNWQTPNTAYWSLHANLFNKMPPKDNEGQPIQGLRNRSLGHNYFKLSCQRPNGARSELINGMTMDSYPSDYRGEFHWIGGRGKYGMAFLFHNFSGRLDIRDEFSEEDRKRLFQDLNARKKMASYGKTNRQALSFISWEITPDQCEELTQYFENFKSYGGNTRYGFMVHPLNEDGELNVGPELGSGCSEFVASFVQKAGLMKESYKLSWMRHLYIPNDLIGTPSRAVRRSTVQNTRLPWGNALDEKHTLLSFWDPELMHDWALDMHQKADGLKHVKVMDGKARGILIKN